MEQGLDTKSGENKGSVKNGKILMQSSNLCDSTGTCGP